MKPSSLPSGVCSRHTAHGVGLGLGLLFRRRCSGRDHADAVHAERAQVNRASGTPRSEIKEEAKPGDIRAGEYPAACSPAPNNLPKDQRHEKNKSPPPRMFLRLKPLKRLPWLISGHPTNTIKKALPWLMNQVRRAPTCPNSCAAAPRWPRQAAPSWRAAAPPAARLGTTTRPSSRTAAFTTWPTPIFPRRPAHGASGRASSWAARSTACRSTPFP
jgi:hypothetical protein